MIGTHLPLTTSQLDRIQEAARHLPVHWRSRYLSAVEDGLLAVDPIEDADVEAALEHVAARMGFGVGGPADD